MKKLLMKRWWVVIGILLVMAVTSGVFWWQRTPLLCWYHLRGLESATDESREHWVNAVVALDTAAVPGLLDRLGRQDEAICNNAGAALVGLAKHWGADDARTLDLATRISTDFDEFSVAGKEAVLEWQAGALQLTKSSPTPLAKQATKLLEKAVARLEGGVRRQALALADILAARDPSPKCLQICAELIRRELQNPETSLRVQAVHLTLHSTFQNDTDLLQQVLTLLKDNQAEVRRAALLAVGSNRELLREDDMLPLLHDNDGEVRRLCIAALRSRGLTDDHILLGKLISDSRPRERLQIVRHLPHVNDIEPAIWLQRLSRDSSDAVRAAAVRMAGSSTEINLQSRLTEMAQSDPSETVRQLARYYLHSRRD